MNPTIGRDYLIKRIAEAINYSMFEFELTNTDIIGILELIKLNHFKLCAESDIQSVSDTTILASLEQLKFRGKV